MANPFKTPEFKRLFREWNNRLAESGFQDAENFNLPEPALKKCVVSQSIEKLNQAGAQGKEIYFELACGLLHSGFQFKNDLHKRTWELHCMGMSVRQIVERLRFQLLGYKGLKHSNVQLVIEHIQRDSGMKRAG